MMKIQSLHPQSHLSNYQDLIKALALIAMLFDHLGLFYIPNEISLRIIGRFAMPIFAFYAGYNFHHKIRHMIWICGTIITLTYSSIFVYAGADMLIGIAAGQIYLFYAGKAITHHPGRFLVHFIGMLLFGIISQDVIEYGTLIIAFMQVGYLRANGLKDPGYLLLAGLAFAIRNQYVWEFDTVMQFSGALISVFASVILLQYVSHNKPISVNLKPISRNMLYIYTITTIGYIVVCGIENSLL